MKTNSRSLSHVFTALALLVLVFSLFPASSAQAGSLASSSLLGIPPFSGTIFIDPDIITDSDPTTFLSVVYTGQGLRTMFDRRVDAFITVNAYLFSASFSDGLSAEIQVNPEFGSPAAALVEAQKYAPVIGRLPTVLRLDVETVWIHKGTQPFGGGNNNLLIHTGQADLYIADGILEETFVHEAAHTSLDAAHAAAPGWLAAQTADDTFISTYAQDNPTREDIAESFLPYLAVKYKPDRISQSLADTILQTIPNRIAYFDNQAFDWYPMQPFADVPSNYWSRDYIERLYNAGITGGCSVTPLNYCPEGTVTRAQMAIFLLRGMHGSLYSPPPVGGSTGFGDVQTTYWAAAWIKQLAAEGITSGCGGDDYCPEGAVTRAQMAVFLLKGKHGSAYGPPGVGGGTGFSDVPATYWAAAWIKQLAAEGITSGCGTGTYCPDSSVTRAQMAVFLVRTFNLP